MTRPELEALCAAFPDAEIYRPFREDITIFRHADNGKWFAFTVILEDKLSVNLKTDPADGVFLREAYEGIRPGWHMNKTHWITAEANAIPKPLLEILIRNSYESTRTIRKKEISR